MKTQELVKVLAGYTGHVHYGMGGYNGAPTYRQEYRLGRDVVPGCGFTWTDANIYANPQSGDVAGDLEELEDFIRNAQVGLEIQWDQYSGSNWECRYTFRKISADSWSQEYGGE